MLLGHDLGLSVVGGSNRTNRGEIVPRESVGGTRAEKTPLRGSVGLVALNLDVLAMWHGLHSGCTLSIVLLPPAANSMM